MFRRRARLGIGYLAQEPSIFRRLSVEENLMAVLQMRDTAGLETSRRKMDGLLRRNWGLTNSLRRQMAATLSGGEKRRCEVARALVTDPKFLLLDEPFVGIDPLAVADLQNVVKKLKARGIGVLITDHNVRETLEIVDRAYIMYEGRRADAKGACAQELLADPEARRVYLRRNSVCEEMNLMQLNDYGTTCQTDPGHFRLSAEEVAEGGSLL